MKQTVPQDTRPQSELWYPTMRIGDIEVTCYARQRQHFDQMITALWATPEEYRSCVIAILCGCSQNENGFSVRSIELPAFSCQALANELLKAFKTPVTVRVHSGKATATSSNKEETRA